MKHFGYNVKNWMDIINSTEQSAIAWLNGRLLPLSETVISIDDRGFQFADGIYEVLRVYHGRLFAFREHFSRLARSARAILLELPLVETNLLKICLDLIDRNGQQEAEIYLQLTRGVAPRSLQIPTDLTPSLLVAIKPPRIVPAALRQSGVSMITTNDDRWAHCDIKATALLPNVLALARANQAGAYEPLFVRNGFVTEGASSNFFLVCNRTLVTAIADWRILPGITRHFVLQLAQELEIPLEQRDIPQQELAEAEEAFLTSTFREVLPVTCIDGCPVGDGEPGLKTRALQDAFQRLLP
jgi:D-alanine transaminase